MLYRHREAMAVCWQCRRDIARFAIMFRLVEAFALTPLLGFAGHFLSGRSVVDSTDLVEFFTSPRGFLATFLGATLVLTIRLVEQAGLSAITLGALGGIRVTSPAALRLVVNRLPRLLAVAAWVLVAGLAVAASPIIVCGLFARELLARHDINYYLAERPPEFLTAAAVTAVALIPSVVAAVWLAVRWRLVVPVLLCEQGNARQALRSSVGLAGGNWRRVASAWIITLLVVLALGLIAAWFGRLCSLGAALLASSAAGSPMSIFAALLVVHTLLTGLITLPGPCFSAGVFATLYCDLRRAREPDWNSVFRESSVGAATSPVQAIGRFLLMVLPFILGSLALAGTFAGLGDLYRNRPVAVTAHRGGTLRSIENTLAAIREAIDVGAQFAEIDVQMSQDEVLVVTHDSDFSRQAGIPKKVWDLTYDEIREIPLTRAGAPEIAADHAPTFDEVLDVTRGQIRVNIELKYYGDHQPRLAERVVAAIRAKGMVDQVVIQSLHNAGLEEVRRLAPEIAIGYLFSVNAREPNRLDVDFLSVQAGRVNRTFIQAAHRRKQEVHVWTVDKPADMQRLIALGVDNLITNRPQEALELVRERDSLSPIDRALNQVRAWLSE